MLVEQLVYGFMQHHDTNMVISKYVQPDLNLPEHQRYDIERQDTESCMVL